MLSGLTCLQGPEPTRVRRGVTKRDEAELRREAKEAQENQERLRREFYERQEREAA